MKKINFLKITRLNALFLILFFPSYSYADNVVNYNTSHHRYIQLALKEAGFYESRVDGIIGPQTRKAIKEFQKKNGLEPDGIVGKSTLKKLSKRPPARIIRQINNKKVIVRQRDSQATKLKLKLKQMEKQLSSQRQEIGLLKNELSKKDSQINQLTEKIQSHNQEQLKNTEEKNKEIEDIKSDYENMLRMMSEDIKAKKHKIEDLMEEKESLLEEKINIKKQQSARMEELLRINRELGTLIELHS